MAHIKRMTDKPRTLPWRAQVKRDGRTIVKMFPTRELAERWAREEEKHILEKGLPRTIKELKSISFSDLLRRYLKEIIPTKGSQISETATVNAVLRKDIAKKSLASITRQDAINYRNARLKETWKGNGWKGKARPIAPSTVQREFNILRHVFSVAKNDWGYENLVNPFQGVPIKGGTRAKRPPRRLKDGEEGKLWKAHTDCLGLNRIYVPLAIALALHTGMRLQEIFNLVWEDVDFKNRRIEIRKSKTDHLNRYAGRTIILNVRAEYFLSQLCLELSALRLLQPTDKIFPMSKGAFKQSWADLKKRAKVTDLHFHDLRHEAASRFAEAEPQLTEPEHKLMMGHAKRDMTDHYIHSKLKTIQDKLDKQMLGGKTLEEFFKELTPAKMLGLDPNKEYRFAQSTEELLSWMREAAKQPGSLDDAGIKGKMYYWAKKSHHTVVQHGD